MKIGIVGLPGCGKTTIFNALTGSMAEISAFQGSKKEPNIAAIKVPDGRLDVLSSMYHPKKTTTAQIQYVDIGGGTVSAGEDHGSSLEEVLRLLRPVDALVNVVRNFERAGESARPQEDLDALETELILADLVTVEKRIERLEKEFTKGKKGDPKEFELLNQAHDILDGGAALRAFREIAESSILKGYAFLSSKPCIVLLNTDDEGAIGATRLNLPEGAVLVEIKGRLEMELSRLSPDEAELFRQEMDLNEPATHRLIRESYQLLGLISFFTVGEDEVKAWTIHRETPAQKAAGAVHSDIEKGFIRAEVVPYEDLVAHGSHAKAQKAGKVRLEGKDYPVKDGDVINFRFNV